jgi:hypothetical protein
MRVEVLADVEVGLVVAGLLAFPLVAGPAEVLDDVINGVGDAVYLLSIAPADVADPNLVGAGSYREAEGVPEPEAMMRRALGLFLP